MIHRRYVAGIALSLCLIAPAPAHAVRLKTQSVPLAENVVSGTRVDRIRFLGMLSIPNQTLENGIRLGQLSDIAWDETAEILYAISDKGALFHLRPLLAGDTLVGLELLRAVPLRELGNGQPLRQRRADSEGLDLIRRPDGSAELVVSFERFPRIVGYLPDGHGTSERKLPPPLASTKSYRNDNSMLEAMCVDSTLGVLTMPEQPLKREPPGFNRIYDLAGKSWLYPISSDDNVVALQCLGNGAVLVLERDLGTVMWNFKIGLKRVRLPAQPTDAPLPIETLAIFDTRKGFQVDNFEGLARHRGRRFFMISDDNDLFLQRTLLLYFEIVDDR
jgi:hypothetical protein